MATALKFASRAGEKLDAALEAFGLDVSALLCADFGCNVGGFTDCLLRRGAARVYALDTGYGALAWTLRKDPRVVVMERTNALYVPPAELVDLVTSDVSWTPQSLVIPAALKWLKPGGRVVSLLKPHYEMAKKIGHSPSAPLSVPQSRDICLQTCLALREKGAEVLAVSQSVLEGKGGNIEFLLLITAGHRS